MKYKEYYRRNLPHYQPEGGVFFITYHQKLVIPGSVKLKIKEKNILKNQINKEVSPEDRIECLKKYEKKVLSLYDEFLDLGSKAKLLNNNKVTEKIIENLTHYDGIKYKMYCFCIMPNHVHFIIEPKKNIENDYFILADIMKSIKGYTAREINKILGLKGQFWHHENYDHYIRNLKDFENSILYCLQNPFKAGLCDDYKDWNFSWVCDDLKEQFY